VLEAATANKPSSTLNLPDTPDKTRRFQQGSPNTKIPRRPSRAENLISSERNRGNQTDQRNHQHEDQLTLRHNTISTNLITEIPKRLMKLSSQIRHLSSELKTQCLTEVIQVRLGRNISPTNWWTMLHQHSQCSFPDCPSGAQHLISSERNRGNETDQRNHQHKDQLTLRSSTISTNLITEIPKRLMKLSPQIGHLSPQIRHLSSELKTQGLTEVIQVGLGRNISPTNRWQVFHQHNRCSLPDSPCELLLEISTSFLIYNHASLPQNVIKKKGRRRRGARSQTSQQAFVTTQATSTH